MWQNKTLIYWVNFRLAQEWKIKSTINEWESYRSLQNVGLALIMFLKHVISFWHALKDPLIVTPSRKLAMFSLVSLACPINLVTDGLIIKKRPLRSW